MDINIRWIFLFVDEEEFWWMVSLNCYWLLMKVYRVKKFMYLLLVNKGMCVLEMNDDDDENFDLFGDFKS